MARAKPIVTRRAAWGRRGNRFPWQGPVTLVMLNPSICRNAPSAVEPEPLPPCLRQTAAIVLVGITWRQFAWIAPRKPQRLCFVSGLLGNSIEQNVPIVRFLNITRRVGTVRKGRQGGFLWIDREAPCVSDGSLNDNGARKRRVFPSPVTTVKQFMANAGYGAAGAGALDVWLAWLTRPSLVGPLRFPVGGSMSDGRFRGGYR